MLTILRKQSNTKEKHLSEGDLSELVVLSEVFPSLAPNNSCLTTQVIVNQLVKAKAFPGNVMVNTLTWLWNKLIIP